ncbi:MAG: hypothetical protein KJZ98_08060 [Burkholderiaceae bacterium]|nr:hypothetical protein [Burkholderiaceae bacterium]MEB2350928.1 hypothetical protein [Burkholderiaceae bacterium]
MEGRKNVGWGFVFLGLFMAAGLFLGYMHDVAPQREQWIAQYASGTHFESRMAHAHGGLFGLINVAVGLALAALPIPASRARGISWLALAGLLMPIGIFLHLLFGVPPVLVFIGGAAMIVATLWLGREALRLRGGAPS